MTTHPHKYDIKVAGTDLIELPANWRDDVADDQAALGNLAEVSEMARS
jgi:hypothetical protein